MTNKQITIETLKDLQGKYDKLYSITKGKQMKDHYYNLIQAIDDIIEDLKEEA